MKLLISMLCTGLILTGCNSTSKRDTEAAKAKQETIDSMSAVMAKQAAIDSMNTLMAEREEALKAKYEEESQQIDAKTNTAVTAQSPSQVSSQAQVAKKKKWNHTAKGAVVGAGTGAITGAIVNKNRVEGAVIGTLIGAGVGAGTGAIVDASKKKKNKEN
jgi:F0F1-type ATP synthase assembly protein I